MNIYSLKNNTRKVLTGFCLFLVMGSYLVATQVFAANEQINYQGKLTNASNVAVANGTYLVSFSLYTASTSGTAIWTETRSGGNRVTVTNGLFSVMLGEVTPLTGVNFDQTLYLGVTIEADAEMSPRKILGTVPAAFVANNANTVGGVASTSLVRNDRIAAIATTSASTLLTVTQNGSGKVLDLFSSATNVFTVLNNGNVGIGSSTPGSRLTVAGNTFLGGNLTATGTLAISGTSTLATTSVTSLSVGSLSGLLFGTAGNVSSVATSTLGIALGDTTGILAATRGGTGLSTITQNQLLIGGAGNTWSQVATSSLGLSPAFTTSFDLATIISNETGSGSLVFSNAPTFSGTVVFPSQIQMSGTFFARSGNHNLTLVTTGTTFVTLPTTGTLYGTATSSITSANLLLSLSDKTGTGTVVFSDSPTFTGTALFASTTNSGRLTVAGTSTLATTTITDLVLAGAFRDTTNSAGTSGMVLQTTGTSTRWVATSTLGISGGASLFTDGGATTYLTSLTDNLSVGTTTSLGLLTVATSSANAALAIRQDGTGDILNIFDGATNVFTIVDGGNIGIGTTSPLSRLAMQKTGMTGTQTAGIDQYFGITNSTLNAVLFGNNTYIDAAPSATSTIAGSIIKIADNTTLGNNVQGLQVQTNRGSNTRGENTAIAGFGRTFGVRGTTEGDAGALFEPAGVFAETRGTTLGNALRAYSDSITTTDLVSFDQDSSAFSGNGLTMDFGTGGSFTGNFMKLRNGGTDRLTIDSLGGIISSSTLAILGTSTLATTTVRDLTLAGAFRDTTNSAGTNGMVLQTTGTSTRWVATSTLGFSGGGSSLFTDGGATTYLTSVGDNLGVGTTSASERLTVNGSLNLLGSASVIKLNGATWLSASSTRDNYSIGSVDTASVTLGTGNISFGSGAGGSMQSGNTNNTYLGLTAGHRADGSDNVALGAGAGYGIGGGYIASGLTLLGSGSGFALQNGADFNTLVGRNSGSAITTGNSNITLGYQAGDNLTTGSSNIIIGSNIDAASTTRSNQLNIGNLLYGTGLDGTGTTLSTGNIGIGSTSPSAKLTVSGAGFFGGNLTATGTLAISGTSTLATTTITNLTLAQALAGTSGGTGLNTITQNQLLIGGAGNTWSQVATSSLGLSSAFTTIAQLDALITDVTGVTGTGSFVLSASPTFTGTALFGNSSTTNATTTNATTTTFAISGLTSGRVPFITTGGRLTDSTNITFDGSRLSTLNLAVTGTSTFTGTSTMATTTITNLTLSGAFRDGLSASGTLGQVLQTTGTSTRWVATSTLGFGSGSLFTDGGATTYLTSVSDNLAIGTTTGSSRLTVNGAINLIGSSAGLSFDGSSVLKASTTKNNYIFGNLSGQSLTTGSSIIAIGSNALSSATSSSNNIAIGNDAGQLVTSGEGNVFIGPAFTGYSNTTGGQNVFIGYGSGGNSVSGSGNTFVGNQANNGLVSGSGNVSLGENNGFNLATSSNSVLIGAGAGFGLGGAFQASNLTILGNGAGFNLQTGADNNILIGRNAGDSITTGANNLIIGYDIDAASSTRSNQLNIGNLIFSNGIDGTGTTLSSGNIGIGSSSPSAKLTVAGAGFFGGNLTATGTLAISGTSTLATTTITDLIIARALRDTTGVAGTNGMVLQTTGTSTRWVATSTLGIAGSNFFTDAGASTYLTSLTDNLAIGSTSAGTNRLSVAGEINIDSGSSGLSILGNRVLYASSTNDSVLLGIGAGQSLNGNSIGNTVVGNAALQLSTSSVFNTAIGYAALNSNTEGNYNTAVGASALISNTTGISNSAFGLNAMRLNIDGSFNVAYGNGTLYQNTEGGSNTALGYNTLAENTIGSNNVAVGQDALGLNASGTQNTAIGMSAGVNLINNQFEGRNTLIGYNTGNGITTGINNTIIGANVTGLSATLSDNIIIADGLGNQRINVGATGNVGIGTSSPSSKLDVWGNLRVGTSSLPNLFVNTANSFVGIGTTTKLGTASLVIDGTTALLGNSINNDGTVAKGLDFDSSNRGYFRGLSGTAYSLNILNTSNSNDTKSVLNLYHGSTVANSAIESSFFTGNDTDLSFITSLGGTETEKMRITSNGNVGIGSTTPSAKLTVAGTLAISGTSTLATTSITRLSLTGALLDSTNASGTLGMVLQSTGTSTRWVATSTLGISGGASTFLGLTDTPASYTANRVMFTNTGASALTDSANLTFDGDRLSTLNLNVTGTSTFVGTTTMATTSIAGALQMGTTSVASRFNLDVAGFNTAGTAGLNRYYTSTNAASGTVQFGELAYNKLSATATTTYVGSMFRVEDSTTFGNTVRGLEVQTNRGTNTRGENTALSGFARTFGVRGFTSADAGGVFEPAGGYFETGGTTQGNAIRGYSSTITSASLMSLFQDTSAYTGTGLNINLGNGSGSFTGNFANFQKAGVSQFTVSNDGSTGIGAAVNSSSKLTVGGNVLIAGNASAGNSTVISSSSQIYNGTGYDQIDSMTVYKGELYFGTTGLGGGGDLFKWDGSTTTRVYDGAQEGIYGMIVYKDKLYFGQGQDNTDSAVFVYDGSTTTLAVAGKLNREYAYDFAVFNNRLYYTAIGNGTVDEAEVYVLDASGTSSTLVHDIDTQTFSSATLEVFNGQLYVAYSNVDTTDDQEEIHVYTTNNGTDWGTFTIIDSVTDLAPDMFVRDMIVYNSRLLVSVSGTEAGDGRVFDIETAAPEDRAVGVDEDPALFQTGRSGLMRMTVAEGKLYVGRAGAANDVGLFAYTGGEPVLIAGSSDFPNYEAVRSIAYYNNELYVGLGSSAGEADLFKFTSGPQATSSYALQFATDSGLGYNATGSIWFESRDIFGGFNDDTSGNYVPGTFFMSHTLVTNAGAYDVAEDYPTDDSDLKGGDLLMYDEDNEGGMTRANANNRHLLAGVVSARPGFLLSQADRTGMVPTALVGRVPVKVSTENGAIKVGDSITISSEPGVGMRASIGDRAVGYALESLDEDDENATSTVLVFVTTHTAFGLSPDIDMMMASTSTSTSDTTLRQSTFFGRLTDLARNFVDGVLSVIGIKAQQVQTDKLCIGDTCVTESQLQQLLQNSNQTPVTPDEPEPDPEPTPDPEGDGGGEGTGSEGTGGEGSSGGEGSEGSEGGVGDGNTGGEGGGGTSEPEPQPPVVDESPTQPEEPTEPDVPVETTPEPITEPTP